MVVFAPPVNKVEIPYQHHWLVFDRQFSQGADLASRSWRSNFKPLQCGFGGGGWAMMAVISVPHTSTIVFKSGRTSEKCSCLKSRIGQRLSKALPAKPPG